MSKQFSEIKGFLWYKMECWTLGIHSPPSYSLTSSAWERKISSTRWPSKKSLIAFCLCSSSWHLSPGSSCQSKSEIQDLLVLVTCPEEPCSLVSTRSTSMKLQNCSRSSIVSELSIGLLIFFNNFYLKWSFEKLVAAKSICE